MKKEKRNKDVNCFADAAKTNIGRKGIKGVKSRPLLIEVCKVEETIYFDKPFKSLGKISKLKTIFNDFLNFVNRLKSIFKFYFICF